MANDCLAVAQARGILRFRLVAAVFAALLAALARPVLCPCRQPRAPHRGVELYLQGDHPAEGARQRRHADVAGIGQARLLRRDRAGRWARRRTAVPEERRRSHPGQHSGRLRGVGSARQVWRPRADLLLGPRHRAAGAQHQPGFRARQPRPGHAAARCGRLRPGGADCQERHRRRRHRRGARQDSARGAPMCGSSSMPATPAR